MISCVLPCTERKIYAAKVNYNTDEQEERQLVIKSPDLIMSHTLHKPWVNFSKIETYFSLYAIDLSKSDICVSPYQLANVYPSAQICFGDVAMFNKPTNLRQANNYFWASPFNDDNCPYLDNHHRSCETRQHDHFDEQRIRDLQEAGKKLANNDSIQGLLGLTSSEEDLGARCSCCLNECSCSCQCDLNEVFFAWIENYGQQLQSKQKTRSNNLFYGEKHYLCSKPASALFISNHVDILGKIPAHLHQKDMQSSFVIGTAKPIVDGWDIDFTDKQITLESKEIEVI